EIRGDGFEIHAEVKISLATDRLSATPRAIASGISGMCDALEDLSPDLLLVYADRFEGFAAIVAGTQMGVPTGHIEGGDLTDGGALDDSVRHAMTKLAHLHFTTNDQATNRILGMGEESWRVHTVGFPAIDNIARGNMATGDELVDQYGLDLDQPVVIFTQHSVATEFDEAEDQLAPSLTAMFHLANEGAQILLTYPNNDAGGRRIITALEAAMGDAPAGVQLHRSLGRYNYHGALALARRPGARVACIGNSSSGIKETPAFGCPTVNIGARQHGRLRADNVIDTDYDAEQVYDAARRCFDDEDFRNTSRNTPNPYGTGDAGVKIAAVVADVRLDKALIQKGMTLAGEARDGWFR
ncbi:MAG: UDP-N-acetylglucosamine 2-epimerase (hydrolyzing), partial [Alphaproteobacteria bacterium]|nr:UDP-N-acetylglucosamine 2-epimerase (hydrolyzing) [Alphaproteobacteria bacterium]